MLQGRTSAATPPCPSPISQICVKHLQNGAWPAEAWAGSVSLAPVVPFVLCWGRTTRSSLRETTANGGRGRLKFISFTKSFTRSSWTNASRVNNTETHMSMPAIVATCHNRCQSGIINLLAGAPAEFSAAIWKV